MDYSIAILDAGSDPQRLEELYQSARRDREQSGFASAIHDLHGQSPENLLYAAWHYRLGPIPAEEQRAGRANHWLLAAGLGLITGLVLYPLTIEYMYLRVVPHLFLFGAPIAAVGVLAYMALTGRLNIRQAGIALAGLAVGVAAVLLLAPEMRSYMRDPYLMLATLHLLLLSWSAVGFALLGLRPARDDRFAFMNKSVEVFVTAGLYFIGGVVFYGITFALFQALNIEFPSWLIRLFLSLGLGLTVMLAVATSYNPRLSPSEQDFSGGLSKTISILMRLLLPLTLLVLVAYIIAIPFNFMEPFRNREVLVIYNAMLFAIMGLLVGIIPVNRENLSPRIENLLRTGILALAVMVVLVSIYALSATVYRTIEGGFTMNRTVIIGWNTINIAILLTLIASQLRTRRDQWLEALHAVTAPAAIAYTAWALFILIVIPIIFPE